MIRMTQVRKVYRTGLLETDALSDFTIDVAKGEFVALMGPSGSGKTTFLNVAGLLDTYDGGDYRLDGQPVAGFTDHQLSRLRNQKFGFIFQTFNLIPDLDVIDNVDVPLRYRRLAAAERRERIDDILDRVGMTARRRHLPSQLSGGQQQRVAIARALVGAPEIVLCDEPTGNLDSLTARQIMDLLETVNRAGTTVVMVTHDRELAARAGRRLHILDGKCIDPRAPRAAAAGAQAGPA